MRKVESVIDLQLDAVKADIAWLAGFWDADGSVLLTKRSTYLVPVASCVNTNKKIIDNVMRILDAADLAYGLQYQDRGERLNAKPAWIVRLEGKTRVSPFLQMIRDGLVGKQEQADLVLKWCRLPKTNGPKPPPEGYWEIREEVQLLNARGRVRD
jgi:hypothetical protein